MIKFIAMMGVFVGLVNTEIPDFDILMKVHGIIGVIVGLALGAEIGLEESMKKLKKSNDWGDEGAESTRFMKEFRVISEGKTAEIPKAPIEQETYAILDNDWLEQNGRG